MVPFYTSMTMKFVAASPSTAAMAEDTVLQDKGGMDDAAATSPGNEALPVQSRAVRP
jgi:hypothetical protein